MPHDAKKLSDDGGWESYRLRIALIFRFPVAVFGAACLAMTCSRNALLRLEPSGSITCLQAEQTFFWPFSMRCGGKGAVSTLRGYYDRWCPA